MLVSVIIPTYNRPERLRRCLECFLKVDFDPQNFEVIVVDDGSPQDLSACLPQSELGPTFYLLRQANAGPGAARNRGATRARGDFLVFIDDDCYVTQDFLRAYASAFVQDPNALWGGAILTSPEQNLCCRAAQWIADAVDGFFNSDPDRARFFSSNNFALSRQAFLEIKGFDEDSFQCAAEDREICDRWSFLGRRLRKCPDASLFHEPPLGFVAFARMYFRYGRGAYHYQRIRAQRKSGKISQDLGFHRRLPGLLMKRPEAIALAEWPAFFLLVAVWQLGNTLGFFYEAVRDWFWPRSDPGIFISESWPVDKTPQTS